MNLSATPILTLLVHRPGRMVAIVAAAVLAAGAALVLVLQFNSDVGRGSWTLALMVPMMVGFAAIMRTGTSRCEVELGQRELVVRSVDSSQILGRRREVGYGWDEVRSTAWVGKSGDQLRLDFATAPRALVFSGTRRDLETLAAAIPGAP